MKSKLEKGMDLSKQQKEIAVKNVSDGPINPWKPKNRDIDSE
jgi:hypothetical protein